MSDKITQATQLLHQAAAELRQTLKSEKGRKRGALNKALFEIETHFDRGQPYMSQAGQDRIVDRVLKQKTGGVFVDVGGYNGVKGSNTLFFELMRGWSGVLIEPSPTQLRQAERARSCPCVGVAVAGAPGRSEFLEITAGYTQMSGFLDSYDTTLLDRVRAHPNHNETVHALDHVMLSDVLNEHRMRTIDFVSLDVEGGI